ncbi:MAG: hypothetical protein RMM28_06265 [Thermoleophilia bacterium]|nr:hypothetical protein [Gaiellaceae bacterium]MDW8338725.1 hypothetical protein [Thermoleophilia bacterium]
MPILQIDHRVRDFASWKQAFESDPVGREAGGVTGYRIFRLVGDPNHVVIDLEFETIAEAEAFGEKLRALWETAGPRLGLESPTARVLESVENETY